MNISPIKRPTLSAEDLKAGMELVKNSAPKHKACVVSPRVKAHLDAQKLGVVRLRPEAIFGTMELFVKEQTCDCWAFSDLALMRKYLAGEVTERDLVKHVTAAQVAGVLPANTKTSREAGK